MADFLNKAAQLVKVGRPKIRVAMCFACPGKERWLFVVDDLSVNVAGPAVGITAVATCEPLIEHNVLLFYLLPLLLGSSPTLLKLLWLREWCGCRPSWLQGWSSHCWSQNPRPYQGLQKGRSGTAKDAPRVPHTCHPQAAEEDM